MKVPINARREATPAKRSTLSAMGLTGTGVIGPGFDPEEARWRLREHLRQLERCQLAVVEVRGDVDRARGDEWRGPAARACAAELATASTTLLRAEHRLDAAIDRCRQLLWSMP
jgi:hypothetical protein